MADRQTAPTFAARSAAAARLTEERLVHWLGSAKTAPRNRAETALGPARLADALRHATLGGGKRFRPFLVLESSRLFDVDPAIAVDVAVALECIHCYSLVHDDLPAMDNDAMRRGRPTVWKAFDEWTAILSGDALLTLAFEILSHPALRLPPSVRLELVHDLATASGRAGMVGGQQLDLDAEKRGEPAGPTVRFIRTLQQMKTGALIRFAATAGARMAERPLADESALATFGDDLGLAFQISDDLLDAEGDAAVVGKAVAKDAAANKATLAQTVDHAIAALAPFGAKADGLRDAARFMLERRH